MPISEDDENTVDGNVSAESLLQRQELMNLVDKLPEGYGKVFRLYAIDVFFSSGNSRDSWHKASQLFLAAVEGEGNAPQDGWAKAVGYCAAHVFGYTFLHFLFTREVITAKVSYT